MDGAPVLWPPAGSSDWQLYDVALSAKTLITPSRRMESVNDHVKSSVLKCNAIRLLGLRPKANA